MIYEVCYITLKVLIALLITLIIHVLCYGLFVLRINLSSIIKWVRYTTCRCYAELKSLIVDTFYRMSMKSINRKCRKLDYCVDKRIILTPQEINSLART